MIGKFHLPISAGGALPDPATYCPANGYYDPTIPIPYIPDPAIPVVTPTTGQIILICSTQWDAAINCTITRTNVGGYGNTVVTVYGLDDTVVYMETKVNTASWTFFYQFPSSGGIPIEGSTIEIFKVVFEDVSTTGYMSGIKMATKTGGYAVKGWPVIEAHIKCPNIATLTDGFLSQNLLRYVKFYGNHNSLTSIDNIVRECSKITEFQADIEMNALTTMRYAFYLTPSMEIMSLPVSLPLVTNISVAFQGCGLKTHPPLPTVLQEVTNAQQAFNNMPRFAGILYVPSMPKCTNIINIASQNQLITKVAFSGSYIPNNGSWCIGNLLMEEIDMGSGVWGTLGVPWPIDYIVSDCPSLKKIKLPTSIIALSSSVSNMLSQTADGNVNEITECDFSGSPGINIYLYFPRLKIFYQPTLNINSKVLAFGGTSTRPYLLDSLEIDWINCLPVTAAITISCLYCNFNQTELERIYTSLPDISTGYSYAGTLKFIGSPGYAASDKTIATAKGWVFATS